MPRSIGDVLRDCEEQLRTEQPGKLAIDYRRLLLIAACSAPVRLTAGGLNDAAQDHDLVVTKAPNGDVLISAERRG